MNRAGIEARIRANPVEGGPEAMRAAFARLAGHSTDVPQVQIGGVPARVFGEGPTVLWLHGGGYVFGSSITHSACAARLARSGLRVVVPDYHRAPEHPWPAPYDDARRVLDALGPCPVVGDSAGGHMALVLAREGGARAVGLISPNTDRTGRSTTRVANSRRDAMNDDDADRRLYRMAMPEIPPDDPRASPLSGVFQTMPPVWITASTEEVLLDDTLLLVTALGRAGVPVTARIETGLMHMWTLWPDALPEARATLDALGTWLRDGVAGTAGTGRG